MDTKICAGCHEEKNINCFEPHYKRCKSCRSIERKNRLLLNPRPKRTGEILCNKCGKYKDATLFPKGGYICKTCVYETKKYNIQLKRKDKTILLCPRCGEYRPTTEFNKTQVICKSCNTKNYEKYGESLSENKTTVCSNCGEEKPRDQFPKQHKVCKLCTNTKRANVRTELSKSQEQRVCTQCKQEKEYTEFNRGETRCKKCIKENGIIYREQINNSGNRVCTKCGKTKSPEEYYKGFLRCKACDRVENELRSKELSLLETRTCKICGETKAREKFSKGKTSCKECDRNTHTLKWLKNSLRRHYKKGYGVSVTETELKTNVDITHCNICGKELKRGRNKKTSRNAAPSLDRINNEMNMTLDNTQIICNECNVMKCNRTMDEYIQYLKTIKTHPFTKPSHVEPAINPPSKKISTWANSTYSGHKCKGYQLSFTRQDILFLYTQTPKCPICDCELEHGIKNSHQNSPSLDRINNKKGNLTIEDVWIICHRCNTSKQQFTLTEWKEYAEKVCNLWEHRHTGEKLIEGYNPSKTPSNGGVCPDVTVVSDKNKALNQGVQGTV